MNDDAKDAARYRWLRSGMLPTVKDVQVWIGRNPRNGVMNPIMGSRELDAAIDAAITKAEAEANQ